MRLTPTQISYLWAKNLAGGTWKDSSPGERRDLKELEKLDLVRRVTYRPITWKLTPKGMSVSLLHRSEEPVPAHSVAPDINILATLDNELIEDGGVLVQGQKIEPGAEIKVKGRRGTFKFLDTHVTRTGRVVVNLLGPVGIHQAFAACYLEDAKLVPSVRRKRRRKVKV